MRHGCCVSGIDIATNVALRLLPAGGNHQPADSPLEIGEVWAGTYKMRGTAAPFVEDATVVLTQRLRVQSVARYVAASVPTANGSTDAVYDGLLHWNPSKGYLEPAAPTPYSTQFWRPDSTLRLYDNDNRLIFWEPNTGRRIPWVGVAAPPKVVMAQSLARLSLSRPFAGNLDHEVCWSQLSSVY